MSLKVRLKNTKKFEDFVCLHSKGGMKLSAIAELLDISTSTLSRWKDEQKKFYEEQEAELENTEELSNHVEKLKLKYAIGLLFRKTKTLNQIKTLCVLLETGQIMDPKETQTHGDIYRILEDTARTSNLGVINFMEQLVTAIKKIKIKEGTSGEMGS